LVSPTEYFIIATRQLLQFCGILAIIVTLRIEQVAAGSTGTLAWWILQCQLIRRHRHCRWHIAVFLATMSVLISGQRCSATPSANNSDTRKCQLYLPTMLMPNLSD